jgi:hypothetical protein
VIPSDPGSSPPQAGELPLGHVLGMAPVMHVRSESFQEAYLTAAVVRGPAVILGFGQRAGRVLQLDVCAAAKTPVHRRMTSGTAAYIGEQAIVWTLALPRVDSIYPDASMRTLLNRNVRPFLRGLRRAAGSAAHYFGREWISVGSPDPRPAALLGFEVSPRGAVLIEVIAGVDASLAIPTALATEEERAVDRWLGKAPAGLGELSRRGGDPLAFAQMVMETVASACPFPIKDAPPQATLRLLDSPRSPLMERLVPGPGLRVPIGWLDTGINPATGEVWLGGDALVSAHVCLGIARGDPDPGEVALEGASIADLHEAVRRARA